MEKSFIPEGMKITGDVISDGDLSLYGEVEGNVSIDGTLELNGSIKGKDLKVGRIQLSRGVIESDINCLDYIEIGKNVTVFGNVTAENADIDGAVMGKVDVKQTVNIGNGAVISGQVIAGELSVELGAVCDINLEQNHRDSSAADFFKEYMSTHGIVEKKGQEAAKDDDETEKKDGKKNKKNQNKQ